MPSNKGLIYRFYVSWRNFKTRIVWKSMKKGFRHIGVNANVTGIPFVNGSENISIGDNFSCGKDVRIEAWSSYGTQSFNPEIVIGNNVSLTDRCYLSCTNRIEIMDGVLLGRDTFITDNSHGSTLVQELDRPPVKRPLTSKGSVVIGKNVWVGRQVTILSGVTVGDNSIIGANSLVNKDVPPNCVVAGNPARIVKRME